MKNTRLIDARKQKGMSQEAVAKESGISRSYYTRIELGKHIPSMSVAYRISKVLDVNLDIFFTGNVQKSNKEAS
jgi:putative transcriptional regulator